MSSPFQTINPATGERLSQFEQMSDRQLDDTIHACHDAFTCWRQLTPKERADHLRSLGDELRQRKSELSRLMTDEMGKLRRQSEDEVDLCAAICDWTAENGPGYLADDTRELMQGQHGHVTYQPIGVVYGIQPWNFPAYQVVRFAVASLMAGNGVLLKHSSNVFGSADMLETIFQDSGLPENIFRSLYIDHDQSDDVIRHDLIRGITLTGSPDAGRHVGRLAGEQLKKTVLELGSNDAYIVLADADLERAVKMCVQGRIYNNGETCVSAKRFIVVEDLFEEFSDRFVAAMKEVKTGDPHDEDTELGPIAREDLREELHNQVQTSVEKGARILCGGEIPEGDGYYYPATVLGDVAPGQPAYDDELFGPVASLIKATDTSDAMRIANDSQFGLGGAIFSEDVEGAIELAKHQFDTGMVFINGFGLAQPMMPFGGVKNSGYGREHGGEGVREFTNVKSIAVMAN